MHIGTYIENAAHGVYGGRCTMLQKFLVQSCSGFIIRLYMTCRGETLVQIEHTLCKCENPKNTRILNGKQVYFLVTCVICVQTLPYSIIGLILQDRHLNSLPDIYMPKLFQLVPPAKFPWYFFGRECYRAWFEYGKFHAEQKVCSQSTKNPLISIRQLKLYGFPTTK